ncbi:hypothetical protein [Actinoplanes sp. TFC3]|uniref:hypothetical protein n=1 Tax=Actinoplanes sp. TFC3 TaxID=1710355 RepID=UPI000A58B929|nr:hypothetical protein [Actinoplanes sp. TFC3]
MHQEVIVHLTPAHLARRWFVSVGHLANLRSNGIGPAYLKLGGHVLYRLADIESYEQRSRVGTKA